GTLRFNTADANDGTETTARGGAVANVGDYGHTIVDISDVLASDNRVSADGEGTASVFGGGIFNRSGVLSTLSRLTVVRSTLRNNRLDASGDVASLPRGGGIFTEGGAVVVRDSTLSGNDASIVGDGGAIYSRRSLSVVNSTLSGNKARTGGGLYAQSGAASLSSATVANNSATFDGGGIVAVLGAAVTLRNTIVAKNILLLVGVTPSPDDLLGAFAMTSSYNWIGAGTGSTGIDNAASGNHVGTVGNPLEPFLGPLANNGGFTQTHLLYPISPLVDAGDPAFDPGGFSPALSMDQRLETRVIDGNRDAVMRIDIGAVEVRSSLFADLNGDGRVGLVDLMVIQRHYLLDGPLTYLDGYLNGDTVVDAADVSLLVDNLGAVLAPASPAAPAAVLSRSTDADPAAAPALRERPPRLRAAARREAGVRSMPRRLDSQGVDSVMQSQVSDVGALRASRSRR
ncbi:MAG: choice-of-anchor Q domain-containing protein, partial [Pirellulales bacterium]